MFQHGGSPELRVVAEMCVDAFVRLLRLALALLALGVFIVIGRSAHLPFAIHLKTITEPSVMQRIGFAVENELVSDVAEIEFLFVECEAGRSFEIGVDSERADAPTLMRCEQFNRWQDVRLGKLHKLFGGIEFYQVAPRFYDSGWGAAMICESDFIKAFRVNRLLVASRKFKSDKYPSPFRDGETVGGLFRNVSLLFDGSQSAPCDNDIDSSQERHYQFAIGKKWNPLWRFVLGCACLGLALFCVDRSAIAWIDNAGWWRDGIWLAGAFPLWLIGMYFLLHVT
jgi:hypothetical protein